MSERRICKYCGMELSEDVPHGLRQCHLHAVTRITELEAKKDILENQLREATNFLIDKKLHVDSLYEEGYKLQKRIAELEAYIDQLIEVGNGMKSFLTPYVDGFRDSYPATSAWESLVKDWKEG